MAKKQYPKTSRRTVRKRRRRKKNPIRKFFFPIGGLILVLGIAFATYTIVRMAKRDIFHTFDHPAFTHKYFVRGVDVSHHNSFIHWERLREENVTFAYLKSTEGMSHIDRDYQRNYKLAKEAGLKVGTYHFYTFGLDGEEQAKHFMRNSSVLPNDMIPAIDVEHSSVNKACKDRKEREQVIHELKRLEQALFLHYGKRAVIYTNKDCYRAYIDRHFPENPVWICDLHTEPGAASDKWVIWQFSHTGNLPGVVGEIDLNYYRYSFADFRNLLMP